jgi:predicted tellurium resistance membrane protein TerC
VTQERFIVAELLTVENLIAFLTLTSLEIVLGIDNIIFIAILAGKLPAEQRDRARRLGITVAVVSRLILLLGITWVMHLKTPLVTLLGHGISGKDLILILGGMFLLAKATYEIHHKVRHGFEPSSSDVPSHLTMRRVLVQVMILDMVFSLDSVITAVGLVEHISIMIAAVLTSVGVMLLLSKWIITFIEANPTIKMLALAFLVMIGALLVAEGFHQHIGKGYVYFAMAFSIAVEVLQMLSDKKRSKDPPKSTT